MILKAGGVVAVFTVCAAAGLIKSASLEKRVRELEAFLSALSRISNEIRYFKAPTEDIIEKLDASNEFKNLYVFAYCKKDFEATRNFSKAWSCALEKSRQKLSLDDGDFEALGFFGSMIGTTDAQGQTANCERYKNLLEQRLCCAREEKSKRGRMYTSFGVLAGVFFAVIFL